MHFFFTFYFLLKTDKYCKIQFDKMLTKGKILFTYVRNSHAAYINDLPVCSLQSDTDKQCQRSAV